MQALGFTREGVAGQYPGDAGIALGEGQQQQQHLATAGGGPLLFLEDDPHAAEQRFLDELDQAFKHLRFAGEVAVERRFGNPDLTRQSGGGDAAAGLRFQHPGQGFEDLLAALGSSRGHVARVCWAGPSC